MKSARDELNSFSTPHVDVGKHSWFGILKITIFARATL